MNIDIDAAFNRTIASAGSSGTGVRTVLITFWPPPFGPRPVRLIDLPVAAKSYVLAPPR